MSNTIFEETNIWQVKIETLAWSYNPTSGILNAITDTSSMHI